MTLSASKTLKREKERERVKEKRRKESIVLLNGSSGLRPTERPVRERKRKERSKRVRKGFAHMQGEIKE